MDQRICIKFCVKNEMKCNKVCEILTKAYGESAISKTRAYEWYKRFKDGLEDVEDDERPGRPSTSTTDENVEKVKEMVMNDRRITHGKNTFIKISLTKPLLDRALHFLNFQHF